MQFQVSSGPVDDPSYNPASGNPLRGGANQPPAIVRFVNADGTLAVTPTVKRQLILREVEGAGGPVEVLVNNTKWNGLRADEVTPVPGSQKLGANYITEMPQTGSTEEWEIINMTVDAHPIHVHLIQFQLLNRQAFDNDRYTRCTQHTFPAM